MYMFLYLFSLPEHLTIIHLPYRWSSLKPQAMADVQTSLDFIVQFNINMG